MPNSKRRIRFSDVLKDILRLKEIEPKWQIKVGETRENKVFEVLHMMKKNKEIIDFLPSGRLSPTDIFRGIDCYIVFMDKKHRSIPVSITGPDFVEEHRMQHPEVPILSIKLSTPKHIIRKMIRALIKNK